MAENVGIFDGMGDPANPPHGYPDHVCEPMGVLVTFAMDDADQVVRVLIETPGFPDFARNEVLTLVAAAIASERYNALIPAGSFVVKAVREL